MAKRTNFDAELEAEAVADARPPAVAIIRYTRQDAGRVRHGRYRVGCLGGEPERHFRNLLASTIPDADFLSVEVNPDGAFAPNEPAERSAERAAAACSGLGYVPGRGRPRGEVEP
jgi:hypothetical protein